MGFIYLYFYILCIYLFEGGEKMVNEPEKWTQDKLSAQVKTNKLIKEIIFKTSVGVWHESSLKYIYVNPLIWISIFNVWQCLYLKH